MKPVSKRELLVLAALAGVGSAVLLGTRRLRPVGDVLEPTPALAAASAELGPEAGNPAGDLTLILFTDFNCGACRRAHPQMMAAVAADGGVRLRFLDWPIFGEVSKAAARAALAADEQGLYLPVHRALMQGGRADGAAAEAALGAAGGDVVLLRRALKTRAPEFTGRLARNAFHAFALGLGGTPGHLIGRVLVRGAVSERDFRRAFDRARTAG